MNDPILSSISLFFGLPALILMVDFLHFLIHGRRFIVIMSRIVEYYILIPPLLVLFFDLGSKNSCCGGTAFFSPEHRLSLYTLIILCIIAYFHSSYKKRIASPVVETIANCLLLIGIVLNIFIGIQVGLWVCVFLCNAPIIILFIYTLVKNHRLLVATIEDPNSGSGFPSSGLVQRFCGDLLHLKPIQKIPILLVLCLPLLVVLAGILLVFGQKPDSMIRAFTDTYKQGFSQLDSQCDGVVCGGHFLCTIAARGHTPVVQPIRSGIRGGRKITCNRQLLISNAFEELLETRLPAIHRPVRRLYNRIGNLIHRHYGLFDNKWIADGIYILMKPLEWFFLLVLYTFDARPENRIAQQYMSISDRERLRK
jgi:hypothetical protein